MPQNFQQLVSGVTRFDQLYGMINTMFDVLRSQFSGSQFPANPSVGQPCFRSDMAPARLFMFNGSAWVDAVSGSPSVTGALAEIAAARGSAASLEARLDVALNDDGTLKGDAPASDWWTLEADPVARLSENQFTVQGDKRAIYVRRRAVHLEQDADAKGHVLDAVYADGTTIVSLSEKIVDTGLSGVAYGQEVGNEPLALGFRMLIVEVTDPAGRHVVSLADYGLQARGPGWFPALQIVGAVSYRASPQDITQDGFTIRLFMPDGKPGALATSGKATFGSGLRFGTGKRFGQAVPVRGVKVGCLIPL
jgi:hypothetical protein